MASYLIPGTYEEAIELLRAPTNSIELENLNHTCDDLKVLYDRKVREATQALQSAPFASTTADAAVLVSSLQMWLKIINRIKRIREELFVMWRDLGFATQQCECLPLSALYGRTGIEAALVIEMLTNANSQEERSHG